MKKIQLPNGDTAEFPDEMDDAAIEAVLQQEFAQPPQQQPNQPMPPPAEPQPSPPAPVGPSGNFAPTSTIDPPEKYQPARTYQADALDPFFQGATFEFGDEMKAAVQAGLEKFRGSKESFSDIYGQNVDAIRRGIREYTKENPKKSIALGLAGGIATPGGVGLKVATKAPAVIRAAGTGLVGGSLAGAGSGEDNQDRVDKAVQGGLLGGTVGGLLGGTGEITKRVWHTIVPPGTKKVAERVLAQALSRGKQGMDDLLAKFDALREGGTPAVLADVTKGASDLARTVHARPSTGSEELEKFFINRAIGAPGRIRQHIRANVSDKNPNVTIDDLREAQKLAAGPAYEKAYQHGPIWDDEVGRLLTNPNIKKGIKEGIDIERNTAMAENRPFDLKDYAITGFDDAGDPIMEGVPNTRLLDAAKRGLDDMLDKYRNPVTGRLDLDQRGRSINKLREKLLERMDAHNTAYAHARATYADPQESINAVNAGRAFGRGDYDRVGDRFTSLDPNNQDYYRAGVARELENVTEGAGGLTTDRASKLLNEGLWNRLDQILPSDKAANLRGALQREQAIHRTMRKVTQGSPTARIQAGQDDAENLASNIATGALDTSAFGFATALRNFLRRGSPSVAGGFTEDVADYLAPKLLTSDRAEIDKLRSVLLSRIGSDRARSNLISSSQGAAAPWAFGLYSRQNQEDRR